MMDHHCHVSNSCVGAQNLRIFILWLAYSLVTAGIGAGLKWRQHLTGSGVVLMSMFLAIVISSSAVSWQSAFNQVLGRQAYLLWTGRTLIESYFGGGGQPRGWRHVRQVMGGGLIPVPRELEIQKYATTL